MICNIERQLMFTHGQRGKQTAVLCTLASLLALTAVSCSTDEGDPAATQNTSIQEGSSTLPTSNVSTTAMSPAVATPGTSASSTNQPPVTSNAPSAGSGPTPSTPVSDTPTGNPTLNQGGGGGVPNSVASGGTANGGAGNQAQGDATAGGGAGLGQGGTSAEGGASANGGASNGGVGGDSQSGGSPAVGGAGGASANEGWVDLFNGVDLDGWVANDGGRGDDNSLPIADVFQVANGEIHVYPGAADGSAQVFGNLRSETVLGGSYTLHVEYKWGENQFAPRANTDRDAGILFHITGNDVDKVFPDSLEMQIGDSQAGEELYMTGDLWVLGTPTFADVMIDGELVPVGGIGSAPHYASVHAENPHGEWNVCEIIVDGSNSAVYMLNGVEVHQLYNFTYDGEPLDEGFVSVQAEWAEIYYRNIRYRQQ